MAGNPEGNGVNHTAGWALATMIRHRTLATDFVLLSRLRVLAVKSGIAKAFPKPAQHSVSTTARVVRAEGQYMNVLFMRSWDPRNVLARM